MKKSDEDRYYNVSERAILRPLLGNPIVALSVHWVFQGMLNMDRTERLLRIGAEVVLMGISLLLFVLAGKLPLIWAAVAAFLVAHTLNFLFNGQIWVVLKHFGLVRHSRAEFDEYLCQLSERVMAEPSIEYAAAYGSLVRGEWRPTSDLDVRLVRKPGVVSSLRACWFVLQERTRALINKFPLDVFVLDGPELLAEMRDDERPQEIIAASTLASGKSKR
jgi:predicted nucleotidyltransferase